MEYALAVDDAQLKGFARDGYEWARQALLPRIGYFDYQGCEPSHFMGLSVGGNVAHWVMVLVLAVLLPLDTVGQAALLSGSVGFAVFGSTVEFPVISRARSGASPLESLSVIPKNFLQKNGAMGAAAALLVFLVL